MKVTSPGPCFDMFHCYSHANSREGYNNNWNETCILQLCFSSFIHILYISICVCVYINIYSVSQVNCSNSQ